MELIKYRNNKKSTAIFHPHLWNFNDSKLTLVDPALKLFHTRIQFPSTTNHSVVEAGTFLPFIQTSIMSTDISLEDLGKFLKSFIIFQTFYGNYRHATL